MKKQIFFLTGPTATGKSEIAVLLARLLNAEIISCDSMQVYKNMDILTSKPSKVMRGAVRHRLIDEVPPGREYNVSRYRKEALRVLEKIISRGKTPLFVGGTGLYMSVLIDGIFERKTEDERVRKRLYQVVEKKGSLFLYENLKKIDPQAAQKIHPHDARRIVRALEVHEVTGKPISELQKNRKGLSGVYNVKMLCLTMPRDKLKKRIDERVELMFRAGAVEEVRKLLEIKLSKTSCAAIGIQEIKGYLRGEYSLEEAKELMKRNTARYAKRQMTWFRKDKRIEWIQIADKQEPSAIAKKIYVRLSS